MVANLCTKALLLLCAIREKSLEWKGEKNSEAINTEPQENALFLNYLKIDKNSVGLLNEPILLSKTFSQNFLEKILFLN